MNQSPTAGSQRQCGQQSSPESERVEVGRGGGGSASELLRLTEQGGCRQGRVATAQTSATEKLCW
jgi:hypothetical protein